MKRSISKLMVSHGFMHKIKIKRFRSPPDWCAWMFSVGVAKMLERSTHFRNRSTDAKRSIYSFGKYSKSISKRFQQMNATCDFWVYKILRARLALLPQQNTQRTREFSCLTFVKIHMFQLTANEWMWMLLSFVVQQQQQRHARTHTRQCVEQCVLRCSFCL